MPPLLTPRAANLRGEGAALAAGVMLPPFKSSFVRDGVRHDDAPYAPRIGLLAVQSLTLQLRKRVLSGCDVGAQLGLGRLGSDFRCGLGDEHGTVGFSSGIDWPWGEGVVGRTMLETGYRQDGFLIFVASGLSYGAYYGHTIGIPEREGSVEDLLKVVRPGVVVSQNELAWASSASLGFPLSGGPHPLSAFLGAFVEKPFVYSQASFSDDDAPHVYSDFKPGLRVGFMVGFSGILAP